MIFEITDDNDEKIDDWNSCKPVDVAGANFAYTFIPTGIVLVVEVKCDVLKEC
ncbi:hypothetical protein [Paenibacillus sp. A3M_27_13]|uniref:hypothetical protein n=1 Tax=Paenibacillus sp. A3M_27_13 TaxID=2962029 RepID=UPI0020B72861|nr:hypothetical protein [Paenibacillus sp. A3M_27_13]